MRVAVLFVAIAVGCSSQNQTTPSPAEVQNAGAPAHDPNPEPEGSLAAFPRATKEGQAHAKELVEQGRALLKSTGKAGASEAAGLFAQATQADPRNASAYWELGWAQQIDGNFEAALSAWKTLRELDPKYPDLDAFITIATARRDEPPPQRIAQPEPTIVANPGKKKAAPRKVEAKIER
jgi:lipoprotein NlpI